MNVTKSSYGIPEGDWFDHVTCPHYLAEIVIYTAMFVVMEMRNVVCGYWWLYSQLARWPSVLDNLTSGTRQGLLAVIQLIVKS